MANLLEQDLTGSIFSIRYNPDGQLDPGVVGGAYATAERYGAPIRAEKREFSAMATPKWILHKVEGGAENTYHINAMKNQPYVNTSEVSNPNDFPKGSGWALIPDEDGIPGKVVTLQTELSGFVLKPYGDNESPIAFNFVIQIPNPNPSSLHLAEVIGVDPDTKELVVQGHFFPGSPTNPPPQWQFIKVN
ncbi:hypothetical protein CVT24_001824 [Panaeolus cyanescens]|uniref:Uncharacterized protein n=1 Tax=Panaeolus cyanescens TaxID=181874 RepID=A0A409YFJ0_9AGAR|nr:hypothetical protein CVT24_001824 [Panaeolus cyanescens]